MKHFVFSLFSFLIMNNALAMETQFSSITDIFDHQEHYANLSLEGIKAILINEAFRTNSEEDVFAALMFWIKKQKQKQFPLPVDDRMLENNSSNKPPADNFINEPPAKKAKFVDTHVRPMLHYINFNQMSRYYLAYIVPNFLEEYDPQLYIDIIKRHSDEKPIRRQPLGASKQDPNLLAMKVEFGELSKWKEKKGKIFFGHRIPFKGYNFDLFLQEKQNGVAGFIRCIADVQKNNHLLPAQVRFLIISPSDSTKIIRSFPPHMMNFKNFDQSIGQFLTQQKDDETWEMFLEGKTSLTEKYVTEEGKSDSKITLIVEIKLLNEPSVLPSNNQFALNFDTDGHNQSIAAVSNYVSGILRRNLLLGDPADSLFQMLTYWFKAEEAKFFLNARFESANKETQEKFVENNIKPILTLVPFKNMTSIFFDGMVKDFIERYFSREVYEKIKSSRAKERSMEWADIRIAWTELEKIAGDWEEWQRNGADVKPFFPTIANVVGTLKNIWFATDSEESILYLALDYANIRAKIAAHIGATSDDEWQSLWESIQWNAISDRYMGDIKTMVENINNLVLNEFYNRELRRREEGGEVVEGTRLKIEDPKNIMIKCVYRDINTWVANKKYYSSAMLINGYKIYFFLQRQRLSPEDRFGLEGFLQPSLGGQIQVIHLPLIFNIIIQQAPDQNGNKERRFSRMNSLFTGTDKAIGGRLSIGLETWEDIINGRSPIVINNTITIIVSIDFNTEGLPEASFWDGDEVGDG